MNDKKTMKIWLPLGIYCILILVQAFLPLPVFRLRHADKLVHFAAYAVLGVLLFRALLSLKPEKKTGVLIFFAVLLSSAMGFSDEIIQVFVPTRSIDRVDFFYDVLGSFSGILLYLGVITWTGRKAAQSDDKGV